MIVYRVRVGRVLQLKFEVHTLLLSFNLQMQQKTRILFVKPI